MLISRRAFSASAAGLALVPALPARAQQPGQSPALTAALAAIDRFAEENRRAYALPALTLGITTPQGFEVTRFYGYADPATRTPLTPDTLFQIGSISKLVTAALIFQFVAQGRLALGDRISALMPDVPLPAGNAITVQHLLDHASGLPADAPLFPPGGLWQGFAPTTHWSYSNTGYAILGKLVQKLGRKPLGRLTEELILAPLGMTRSKGAIRSEDRLSYAQGYSLANEMVPFVRGAPLAQAGWAEFVEGGGMVASTAADMNRLLRSIANAAAGRGGLGLSPALGRQFTSHKVASDTPEMAYGNGLMHVTAGKRPYLHHTGGMVSFTSSMHVDVASGVGAFASSSLGYPSSYRPKLLTAFAVDAIAAAQAGRPLPTAPRLIYQLANPADFAGSYSANGTGFTIEAGRDLMLNANGTSAALQAWGPDRLRTTHPQWRNFDFVAERKDGKLVGLLWGPLALPRAGSGWTPPPSDPKLALLAGRYVNDSPWMGLSAIVERGGQLFLGTDYPLIPIGGGLYRLGEAAWSPERGRFTDFIDGVPQTFLLSGTPFTRHDL